MVSRRVSATGLPIDSLEWNKPAHDDDDGRHRAFRGACRDLHPPFRRVAYRDTASIGDVGRVCQSANSLGKLGNACSLPWQRLVRWCLLLSYFLHPAREEKIRGSGRMSQSMNVLVRLHSMLKMGLLTKRGEVLTDWQCQ